MRNLPNVFLAVCLISWVIGITGLAGFLYSGFFVAIGGVFFVLMFATHVVEKANEEEAKNARTPLTSERKTQGSQPEASAKRLAVENAGAIIRAREPAAR